MSPRCLLLVVGLLFSAPLVLGQDQNAKSPPPGIKVADKDRKELLDGAAKLESDLASLLGSGGQKEGTARKYAPDVAIFAKAVRWALELDEVYKPTQLNDAQALLAEGRSRLDALRKEQTPWRQATGVVIRAYRSKIDGSIQPYAVAVPTDRPAQGGRLDIWLHGRSDTLTELAFLGQYIKQPKTLGTPPRTVTLSVYGRFCNAYKFAGETEVLEAMDHAVAEYGLSRDHVALRGFSMGGAGAWQLGAHHISKWAVVAPGAGFVETTEYAKVDAPGRTPPTEWERKMFRLYDVPGVVLNLANRPVYLYCGDEDPARWQGQKMMAAAKAAGFEIPELVGPKTGHKYHPEVKKQLDALVDAAAIKGRPSAPESVRLATFSLRYPEVDWVRVEGLEKHWELAIVEARRTDSRRIEVVTKGVTRLTLTPPAAWTKQGSLTVVIDGAEFNGALRFIKVGGKWADPRTLNMTAVGHRKRPGLQGPIDDAFMDAFVFVRPTGKSAHPATQAWVNREMALAIRKWKVNFRGEVRVVDDVDVTPALAASANLILWGDAGSNRVIARLADKLPVRWENGGVRLCGQAAEAAHHVPVLIYPNPEAPDRYVVLNSSYTFRQGSDLTNALQTPKLPDWALIDVREPPSVFLPGKVVGAGWFGEGWE